MDSLTFLSGSLDSLSKVYGLEQEKLSFPYPFNKRQHYEYNGPIPDISYFTTFSDDKQKIEQKKKEIEQFEGVWNLKEKILEYTIADVDILTQIVLRFIEDTVELQRALHLEFKPTVPEDRLRYLNPVTQ
ncbi:MAG TPA: DNA polymerase [Ignavibacteriaceae bacterium]